MPLGGRGQNVNNSGHDESHSGSSHKGKAASSSLPRPTSTHKSQSHIPPVPSLPPGVRGMHAYGGGIGLGLASTIHEQRSHLTSNARTVSLMSNNSSAYSGKLQSSQHGAAGRMSHGVDDMMADARKSRHARRESFRPRPSIDDNPAWPGMDGAKYAGLAEDAFREEDEY